MKTKRRFWFKPILAGLVVSVLALTGCGGSDGDDGATGAPGAPASVDISNAEELSAEILSARIQSPPVVEFQLTDGNGNPVRGLPASAISFNVAKLIPGTDGNSSAWQSYLNTLATATAPGAPGLGSTAIQAVTESGSAGTLTYNESTATYTYTFATDVANVTTPLAVPYQPTLTHRITFEIRGFAPVDNPIYNFRPSDNATTGLFTREIVDTQTCNGCHNDLALHGGARADTDECVACHNPGTTDPDSLNTVDFKVMVHKIHRGEDLTVLPYQIWGFRNTLIDFSDVVFPQDIRNCSNCHNTADPNTPDASNWYTVPTAEACGSCHDNVNFETGVGHAAGQAGNDVCAGCHANPTSLPGLEVRNVHNIPIKALSAQYQFNILGIAGGTPGTALVAAFSITDPTNLGGANDPDGLGERYDLSGTPIADAALAASNLRMTVAWDTEDYTNEGNGGNEAQPARTSIVDSVTAALAAGIVDNGDRTYTVALGTVAAGATGSGAVTFEGHPVDATLGNIPVTSAVAYFPITDATAQARRSVVDINGCDRCHDQLSLHGSNRVNNDQVCVACHNPNATDLGQRPAGAAGSCDPAGGVNVGVDGRCEQAIDFKYMVHAIHSSNITVYGFGASVNTFEVRFPQELSNCVACHKSGTYYPDSDGPTLGTTIQSVADYATLTDRTTGTDNIRITPWASVCSSCHIPDAERDDPASTNPARLHMIQNGANFALTSGDPVQEVCSICHGPGKLADLQVVHGVED
jgi:OmcA/MtrC family decaheme c-type cytochrome